MSCPALHRAAGDGKLKAVGKLLKQGADPNVVFTDPEDAAVHFCTRWL